MVSSPLFSSTLPSTIHWSSAAWGKKTRFSIRLPLARARGYHAAGMVLETVARIVELAGAPRHAAAASGLRAAFEARTGAFAPDDAWFEERIRAFWCDA